MTRLGIGFFGITRSLRFTAPKLIENVIQQAESLADVVVVGHFFTPKTIDNPRSKESGSLEPDEHRLLPFDRLCLDDSNELGTFPRDAIIRFGDFWSDNNRSLNNLISQLESLEKVTSLLEQERVDAALFCRPDLCYHDPLGPMIEKVLRGKRDLIVPCWQGWGGYNDRFAIAGNWDAIRSYGRRGERALEFCKLTEGPLHSERLLEYATRHLHVGFCRERATRVRMNGAIHEEDFRTPLVQRVCRMLGEGRSSGLRRQFWLRWLRYRGPLYRPPPRAHFSWLTR